MLSASLFLEPKSQWMNDYRIDLRILKHKSKISHYGMLISMHNLDDKQRSTKFCNSFF